MPQDEQFNIDSFFDDVLTRLEKGDRKSSGLIGKVTIAFGFATRMTYEKRQELKVNNSDLFWPFDPLDDKSKEEAKAKCVDFINQHHLVNDKGEAKKPLSCISYKIRKADVMNKAADWKIDEMSWDMLMFTDDWKSIVKPNMKRAFQEAGLTNIKTVAGTWYAKLAFVPSPNNTYVPPETDQDNAVEPKTKKDTLVAYIDKIYASEELARADCETTSASGVEPTDALGKLFQPHGTFKIPDGWSVDMVRGVVDDIKTDKRPRALIVKDYGFETELIDAIKNL